MDTWFLPYRYADADLRERAVFTDLAALAADLNAWRREHRARSIRCSQVADAWENPEGPVAVVLVELLSADGAAVVAQRTCLTAGEDADTVRGAVIAAHAQTKEAA